MKNATLFTLMITFLFISCETKKHENDTDSFSENPDTTEDVHNLDTDGQNEDSNDTDDVTPDEDYVDAPCGSVYFNGIDSYISVEHDNSLNLEETWTIEAWVMQDDINGQNPIVRKGGETGNPSFWIYGKSSEVPDSYISIPNGGFQYGNAATESSWLQSKSEVQSMKWFHVALSKTESEIMLFVNGTLQNSESTSEKTLDNNENLLLGGRLGNNIIYFSGLIDEIRLSSTSRYSENFTPEKRLSADSETIAVWHFEEGFGTETISEGTSILKGILNGAATFVDNCNYKTTECSDECFFEGEKECTNGFMRSCKKGDDGCLNYDTQECPSGECADIFTCAEHNCPFAGASECIEGKIKVCIDKGNAFLDWTVTANCFNIECADETSCLSCSNECEYEGQTKCSEGKLSICARKDNCLEWNGENQCILECKDQYECRSVGWKEIASGYKKCGISEDGELFCWDNITSYPEKMSSRNDWQTITGYDNESYTSSYMQHFCAIAGGELYCYGNNASGQLGNGTIISSDNFLKIGTRSDWSDISAMDNSTCGIAGEELFCWGAGTRSPQKIGERNDWQKVDGNCGIASGQIHCWKPHITGTTQIGSENDWEDIASYRNTYTSHACGIRNGELFCWGDNDEGQLGDGTNENRSEPVKIGNMNSWTSIRCSDEYTCGVTSGELYCWGKNNYGATGTESLASVNIPVRVENRNDWQFISSNNFNSCGVAGDNIYCWGFFATNSQIMSYHTVPSKSEKAPSFTKISVGKIHVCGISDEYIFCNNFLSGASYIEYSDFYKMSDISGWSEISSGNAHECAINNGELYCMGDNNCGQLGDSTTSYKESMTRIGTGTNWTKISTGYYHTCGIAENVLYCWGKNSYGQLGTGNSTDSTTPVQIGSGTKWSMVSPANTHTCGIADGELFCWGKNSYGELGNGTTTSYYHPEKVGNRNDWETVTTGAYSTCGIANGELFCWGYFAQKITGSTTIVSSPAKISLHNDYRQLATTNYLICALRENGSLYCWNEGNDISDISVPIFPEMVSDTKWKEISGYSSVLCGITTENAFSCINLYTTACYSPTGIINP